MALKLSGLAAKNFALFVYAVLKDQKKTRGKTRLVRMLREQRPFKFFKVPQSYTITSWFGYRADPFTGEIDYHSGTDIGAPGGTPILAAADGTVTIANGIDSWGGGYGYYIKVRHNGTYETLYAHCSSICVVAGQEVKQGEVIGYGGTTGNSTGNYLHFEVWQNGQRTDALDFFVQ